MQKPEIKIYDFSTEEKTQPVTKNPTIITILTFSLRLVDESYDKLTATGEATRYEDSLRDAINNMDWDTYLDAVFTAEEIAILRAANTAYNEDPQQAWMSEKQLATQAQVNIKLIVEDSPINLLAINRLLDRVHMPYTSWQYRITDLGREMVRTHRQFKIDSSE